MTPMQACQERARHSAPRPPVVDKESVVQEFLPKIKYHACVLKLRIPAHIEMDDLISSGVVGLLDAANRFNPTRGIKFKTYADFRIRGAMLDYLREMDWFPRSARQHASRLQNAYVRLENRLGRPPEDAEVAAELKISLDRFRRELALFSGLSVFSLDEAPDDENGSPAAVQSILADAARDESREQELSRELKDVLGKAIDLLPEKERQLIALYYYEDLTMMEISRIFHLGEPRISQIHSQAVLRLRGKLATHFDE